MNDRRPKRPHWFGCRGAFCEGVKRPRHEADHTLPATVSVKISWRCTSTPSNVFNVWCLIKHRNFTRSFSFD